MIIEQIAIAAPAAALFALTQNYERRLEWDVFLQAAYLVGDAPQADVGVRACCVARSGLTMETEYVSFRPPRICAVRMTRGPWFIGSFAGTWLFQDEGPGRTLVTFKYRVRAWPRWLAPLLSPVLAWVFARDTRQRLAALKMAVEQRGMVEGAVGPP